MRYSFRSLALVALLLAHWALTGCASKPLRSGPPPPAADGTGPVASTPAPGPSSSGPLAPKPGGRFYDQDGPPLELPADLATRPDAVPRVEVLSQSANRPYSVFGQLYTPLTALAPFKQRGVGSWYGRMFHGRRTSSNEVYDMFGMTAAHPTLPLPSYARVTNVQTGKQVIVRVNDRGPFLHGRIIDLSYGAAYRLGYTDRGSTELEVELLMPEQIAQINAQAPGQIASVAPVLAAPSTPAAPTVPAATVMPAPLVKDEAPKLTMTAVEPTPTVTAAPPARASAPPRVTGPVPATGAATPAARFFVQLGAFGAKDNADTALARLESLLGASITRTEMLAQDRLYKLQAGPYQTRRDAEVAVLKIKQLSGFSPFIVQR